MMLLDLDVKRLNDMWAGQRAYKFIIHMRNIMDRSIRSIHLVNVYDISI